MGTFISCDSKHQSLTSFGIWCHSVESWTSTDEADIRPAFPEKLARAITG
jgi:hypothetical protein